MQARMKFCPLTRSGRQRCGNAVRAGGGSSEGVVKEVLQFKYMLGMPCLWLMACWITWT